MSDFGEQYNLSLSKAKTSLLQKTLCNKRKFIEKFGITLQMPANYVFLGKFWRKNTNFIIMAIKQSFPEELQFYDLGKIHSSEDLKDDDYRQKNISESQSVIFKLLQSENDCAYQWVSQRQTNPKDYQRHALTSMSDDGGRIALVRTYKIEKMTMLPTKEQKTQEVDEIDIYDCSSEKFFLEDSFVSRDNESFLLTIADPDISKTLTRPKTQLKFSDKSRYCLLVDDSSYFKVYDLEEEKALEKKLLTKPCFECYLPAEFSQILTIKLNEEDYSQSLVAFKRRKSHYIDVVSFRWLEKYDAQSKSQKNSKHTRSQIEELNEEFNTKSLLLTSFLCSDQITQISDDMEYLIHTSNRRTSLLYLGGDKLRPQQKILKSVYNKIPRYIQQFEEENYIIATADSFSDSISFRIAQGSKKKIQIPIRFVEKSVKVMDILSLGGENFKILVSSDDECFQIITLKDFESDYQVEELNVCSLYSFEWPYICYLKGSDEIILQNMFMNKIVFFLKVKDLGHDTFVSHLVLTKDKKLFYLVNRPEEYTVHYKDLNNIFHLLVRAGDTFAQPKFNPSLSFADQHLFVIKKSLLSPKPIYKVFIRDMSSQETHLNEERLIFFRQDHMLHQLKRTGEIKYVDHCDSFVEVNQYLSMYLISKSETHPTSVIKVIAFAFSDYYIKEIYEEVEGKIDAFLACPDQLLLLIKSQKSDYTARFLKILSLNSDLKTQIKYTIEIQDKTFIGNFLTTSAYASSIIFQQNKAYYIATGLGEPKIHKYDCIIPLNEGEQISSFSPISNLNFRKMMFFKVHHEEFAPKSCIVMPYLNDNHLTFNTNYLDVQYNNFIPHYPVPGLKSGKKCCVLTVYPTLQKALLYSQKGKLKECVRLNHLYKELGEEILCVSPDCTVFAHLSNKGLEFEIISLLRVTAKSKIHYSHQDVQSYKKQLTNLVIQKSPVFSSDRINTSPYISVFLVEQVDLKKCEITLESFVDMNKKNAFEVVQHYQAQQCSVMMEMNNNLDLAVGFTLMRTPDKTPQKEQCYLHDLLIIKSQGKKRQAFFVRLPSDEKPKLEEEKSQKAYNLNDCYSFLLLDNFIIVYSESQIYFADTRQVNSVTGIIMLQKSLFEIPSRDISREKASILKVSSAGEIVKNDGVEKLYVIIKIKIDYSASLIKYNLLKDKEYGLYECNLKSECFFDDLKNMFILDSNNIVCCQTGLPLYYYKIGLDTLNYCQNLLEQNFERGSRLCSHNQNKKFLLRNRYYLPYSYYTLMMQDHKADVELNEDNYDPSAIFKYYGNTPLHIFASDYQKLNFILDHYQRQDKNLLNMLLMQNGKEKTVLSIAIDQQNAKCVNLILEKLSLLSISGIHSVKGELSKLLDFDGFEEYLNLCFLQTKQMSMKKALKIPDFPDDYPYHIQQTKTSYLDKEFYKTFEIDSKEKSSAMRSVSIKSIEACWLLKEEYGNEFLLALSECDNLRYFDIYMIRVLIIFMWKTMKKVILRRLFVPFVVNFTLFNIYVLYTFEQAREIYDPDSDTKHSFLTEEEFDDVLRTSTTLNQINKAILLCFSVLVLYIEIQQLIARKLRYFDSIWNMLDLCTAIFPPIIILLDYSQMPDESIRPLSAICILIFYLRFFYFLRIFDSSAPYVRIIIEITADIKIFLLVLMIAIAGFGFSFYILSMNNPYEKQFIDALSSSLIYSYLLALGEFSTDDYNDSTNSNLMWSLFILSSMFTLIILLNMLITIMGDSYTRVTENAESQRFRDRLQLILENNFLLHGSKMQLYEDAKYLITIEPDIQRQVQSESQAKEILQQQKDDKILKHLEKLTSNQENMFKNIFKLIEEKLGKQQE